MNKVIVENDRYTVEPLYQWDVNQKLEIRGLNLASFPEIHFTNDGMERAIVRQATMDDVGIISVDIPNSLLQKPYTIKVYVCIYENDTFKSLYSVNIPVKARKRPSDYTIENDEEIYSFNAIENLVNNTINDVNIKYAIVSEKYNEVNEKYEDTANKYAESNAKLETAITEAEQSKANYDSASKAYSDASDMVDSFIGANGDIITLVNSKANKSTITEATLFTSGWSDSIYSFENNYPVANYDIEIALNSTATAEQASAFNDAQIVGSATSNTIKAFGNVPTVDIPIIVKAVAK